MSPDAAAVASLRVDDAGLFRSFRAALSRVPDSPGLVFGTAGPGSTIAAPVPRNVQPRRVFTFTVWQSAAHLDAAEETWPVQAPGRGWSVRLDPIRMWHRNLPILDGHVPRDDTYDGPVVSLTISQPRLRNFRAFLRASRPAERQVLEADGLVWAAGFSRLPTWIATVSFWESADAVTAYARTETGGGAHQRAVPQVADFFHRSLVMRFRPGASNGSLTREPALIAPM